MSKFVTRFLQDESGATAIEYGLIAALISITIIAAANSIGGTVKQKFVDANTCMTKTAAQAAADPKCGGGT
jgi:pilus assembly protein Flp/PilA